VVFVFPNPLKKNNFDKCNNGTNGGEMRMEPYQWFLLGMMVAWTPSLVALAVMLRKEHLPEV
jgi:hypothetical protein